MAINLQKGQRVSLDNSMKLALVGLGWDTNRYDGGSDFDLDASAFLLGENGKLLRDEDFVSFLPLHQSSVTHSECPDLFSRFHCLYRDTQEEEYNTRLHRSS